MRHISVLSSFVVLSTFVLACSDAQGGDDGPSARIDAAHRDGRIDAPPPGGGSDAGATGGGYDPTHCEMDSPAAPPAASARYIMPTGQGAADGTSWANAAAMSALDAMVAAVGAGGTVYIRADAGEYVFTQDPAVLVAHGGVDGNPVTILGVDGALKPTKAVLVGYRDAWTLPADPEAVTDVSSWSIGPDIFRLALGADHLTFQFFDFQRAGQPFHLTAPTHTGITVDHASAYNFRRFFEHDPVTSHIGTRLHCMTGTGFSKTAIRIRGDSHDVTLEDIYLDSGRQDGDNFATGVELNDTAHQVTMTRVTAKNTHWTHFGAPDAFWNGDGFASEMGNYDITRIDCLSSGNTDAGYDDKGQNIRYIGCVAADNANNFKLWGYSHVLENSRALDPHKRGGNGSQAQVWLAGDYFLAGRGADVVFRGGEVRDNDPATTVFLAEGGTAGGNAEIRLIDVAITKNPAAMQEMTVAGAYNSIFLYGSASDTTPPTITSAGAISALAGVPQALILRADKPRTWSIVSGGGAGLVDLLPNRRLGILRVAAFSSGTRSVTVRARDASNNTSDQTITVSLGGAATTFFGDGFARADGDLANNPDWVFVDGAGAPSDLAVRNQKLSIFSTDPLGILYKSPDLGYSDHYVQATVASVPPQAVGLLCARVVDSWNTIGVTFGATGIELGSRSAGYWTALASTATPPAVGDVLRLELKGTTATVRRNGAVILGPVATGGVGDGSILQGVIAFGAPVDPWIDDYEVGPL